MIQERTTSSERLGHFGNEEACSGTFGRIVEMLAQNWDWDVLTYSSD
jgi:hypothetical protein